MVAETAPSEGDAGHRTRRKWAGDHGLLAEIDGAEKYLADTGESYVEPEDLPRTTPAFSQETLRTHKSAFGQQSIIC